MNRPQRHRGTEKIKASLCLCGSVAVLLCVLRGSVAATARPQLVHAGKLDVLHFKSRALGSERSVRVWLPPKFSKRTTYSVLYLNDGQNLFGDGDPDSGGGGWHVDETAARLIDEQRVVPLIVVGIDNGGERARSVDYLPVPDAFSGD